MVWIVDILFNILDLCDFEGWYTECLLVTIRGCVQVGSDLFLHPILIFLSVLLLFLFEISL